MIGMMAAMAKIKISATLDPDRVAQARSVVASKSLSDLLDIALAALIERELEHKWIRGQAGASDLPGFVPVDLSHIPWDDD